MLVLSRKKEEVIHVGDDVTIKIVGIRGGHVRIGVEAPQSVPIHRGEVYRSLQAQAGSRDQDTPPAAA